MLRPRSFLHVAHPNGARLLQHGRQMAKARYRYLQPSSASFSSSSVLHSIHHSHATALPIALTWRNGVKWLAAVVGVGMSVWTAANALKLNVARAEAEAAPTTTAPTTPHHCQPYADSNVTMAAIQQFQRDWEQYLARRATFPAAENAARNGSINSSSTLPTYSSSSVHLPYRIRTCLPRDHAQLSSFHVLQHLETSARNPTELRNQLADLPSDFPHLLDASLFVQRETRCFVATLDLGAAEEAIIGCIVGVDHGANDTVPIEEAGKNTDLASPASKQHIIPSTPSNMPTSSSPLSFDAEIEALSVASSVRGQGVGSALLYSFIHSLRDPQSTPRPAHSVKMTTVREVMDNAIALYTKTGFKVIPGSERLGGSFRILEMSMDGEAMDRFIQMYEQRRWQQQGVKADAR